MKYNLYWKNIKLNKTVVSKQEVDTVMSHTIVKKLIGDNVIEIPTKDIRVIKCTIV